MAKYEYCVTEAEWGVPRPSSAGSLTGLRALVFRSPTEETSVYEQLESTGRSRGSVSFTIDQATISPSLGWEYVRHDCVGGPEGLIVAVTWRREVSNV